MCSAIFPPYTTTVPSRWFWKSVQHQPHHIMSSSADLFCNSFGYCTELGLQTQAALFLQFILFLWPKHPFLSTDLGWEHPSPPSQVFLFSNVWKHQLAALASFLSEGSCALSFFLQIGTFCNVPITWDLPMYPLDIGYISPLDTPPL